jgi:hypothetical protein
VHASFWKPSTPDIVLVALDRAGVDTDHAVFVTT